jgi:hypothetical protein
MKSTVSPQRDADMRFQLIECRDGTPRPAGICPRAVNSATGLRASLLIEALE